MSELEDRFMRQSEWQRRRARLPWSEKLALAALLRDAALALRARHSLDASSRSRREVMPPTDD